VVAERARSGRTGGGDGADVRRHRRARPARWPLVFCAVGLAIVGDGPQRGLLERTVQELELSKSTRIIGALPRTGVIAQLQQAGVFALPVRTRWAGLNPEGLGLAALEAAACGLPVIVGHSGGTPETVLEADTGFLVPSGDHRLLAERLSLLLENPSLAQQMGSRGRHYVTAHFSMDSARARLREALEL
jgi:phosphatidyl-myo-inositol dimannoside synthase